MNKSELIAAVAAKSDASKKDVTLAVETLLDVVAETLANGDKVSLQGFGTFESRKTNARVGRNPKSGESINIPAGRKPAFKAGKALKEAVK